MESTCEPYENANLESQLAEAVSNIHGEISDYEVDDEMESEDNSIPANPSVRTFLYCRDDVITSVKTQNDAGGSLCDCGKPH